MIQPDFANLNLISPNPYQRHPVGAAPIPPPYYPHPGPLYGPPPVSNHNQQQIGGPGANHFYNPRHHHNHHQHPVMVPAMHHYNDDQFMGGVQSKYNPIEFRFNGELDGMSHHLSRFFVIKSYSKDDVVHSIKHGIWCSTEIGNARLNEAFDACNRSGGGSVYLFFSVNGSGQFCGCAEMVSRVDFESRSELWSQDKWKGKFDVKWIYVKDVPNSKFRHIILPNNENKPVTNSRDAQEVRLIF